MEKNDRNKAKRCILVDMPESMSDKKELKKVQKEQKIINEVITIKEQQHNKVLNKIDNDNKKGIRKEDFKSVEVANKLITVDEIKKRLRGYIKVHSKDIKFLKSGTSIQYVEVFKDNDEYYYLYKSGAILLYNNYPKYVTLSNGKNKWHVQLDKNILFELDIAYIQRSCDNIVEEKDKIIKDEKKCVEQLTNSLSIKRKEIIQINAELEKYIKTNKEYMEKLNNKDKELIEIKTKLEKYIKNK